MKLLSIYIHIPFCKAKCFYCDFTSYADKQSIYHLYVEALLLEIKSEAKNYIDYEIQTIFIGGGTPTVLPSHHIIKIMNELKSNYNISINAEITIESNPGTIDYENLLALKNSGINRISIGLQAWQNRLLKKIGRIHTQQEFIDGFNCAREVGFDNINIDLIFALPEQTIEDWKETLKHIILLKPEHISTYSLIIEDGTIFGDMYSQNKLQQIDDDTDRQMYYIAKNLLKNNGYTHYEISNFAKKNFESKHNIIYWQQKEYIGFGLGAHSYINDERFHNTYDINKYIKLCSHEKNIPEVKKNITEVKKNITEDIEKNDVLDMYAEYMFLGLRLIKGVSKNNFKTKFEKDIYNIYGEQLNECKKLELIKEDSEFLWLTDKGIDVSNIIFEKFLIK